MTRDTCPACGFQRMPEIEVVNETWDPYENEHRRFEAAVAMAASLLGAAMVRCLTDEDARSTRDIPEIAVAIADALIAKLKEPPSTPVSKRRARARRRDRKAAREAKRAAKPLTLFGGAVSGCFTVPAGAIAAYGTYVTIPSMKALADAALITLHDYESGMHVQPGPVLEVRRDLIVIRGEIPATCPLCRGRALSTCSRWACTKCGVDGRVVL